jgi:uncharacterized protein (DUF305 family)
MLRTLTGLALVAALCAGCSGPDAAPPSAPGAAAPGSTPAAAPASAPPKAHDADDVAFVRALLAHHQAGIALAGAAARNPRARVLAEAIIVTQQDEVVRMQQWLSAWGETGSAAPAPRPSAGGDAVRALLDHQAEAVTIAQQEQARGANPTALAFAQQIVQSRTEQVTQLRSLLGP